MSVRWIALLAAPLAAGCIAYDQADADAASVAAEAGRRTGGCFTFAQALDTALRQNARLLELEARARAAGAVTQPLEVQAELRTESEMLAVMVDPVALLRLGARGGEAAVAAAAAEAALAELAVARWQTAAAVAESFAMEAALVRLSVPQFEVDAGAYERAGLASAAAARQLLGARTRAAAEASELAKERAQNLARLRLALGLPAGAPVEIVEADGPLVPQPPASEEAVLARPDLALAAAEFRVADAEFRRAVAEQYPSLMLGPEFPLRGGPLEAMAILRVPLGMAGLAEAARERREAARARLMDAYLQASNGASTADAALAAARAAEAAATQLLQASTQALAAALVSLQVDGDAFERVAEAATMVARDAMEKRAAATALARAEIERAVAFGWPVAEGRS